MIALSGVFAALPTPCRNDGTPDWERLSNLLDFLLEKRLAGVCAGGATGEYAAFSVEDRITLFHTVRDRLKSRASLICCIAGENFGQVIRLARAAADCGAAAVLLPPPAFFPFSSSELLGFLESAAAESPLPVLLYNIPQFTREIGAGRLLGLAGSEVNVVGIKDSSGIVENLQLIRKAKAARPLSFVIGSDELLLEALEHGADGVISGTASALPELIGAIYGTFKAGNCEAAQGLKGLLDEFLSRSAALPPPWAVKLALGARRLDAGALSWPLRGQLRENVEGFQKWLPRWIAQCESACAKAVPIPCSD